MVYSIVSTDCRSWTVGAVVTVGHRTVGHRTVGCPFGLNLKKWLMWSGLLVRTIGLIQIETQGHNI